MPTINDYVSGNILNLIKRGFHLFGYVKTPLVGRFVTKYGSYEMNKCDPVRISADAAGELIQGSRKYAVGQRVCNVLYGGADAGKSVFLDELAVGLVRAGKADYVPREEAVRTICQDRKGPIMITRVSGKHMEICRSIPKNCIYWNAEKHGLKCIKRRQAASQPTGT